MLLFSNLRFFFKTLKENLQFLISNPKLISNLNLFLKAINSALLESLHMLKYKNSKKVDKQLLYTVIKKKGHIIERYIFFPNKYSKINKLNVNYFQLKESLEEWNRRNYENTNPIQWASQILLDYENNYPDGCPECRINDKPINHKSTINTEELLILMKNRRSNRLFSDAPLNKEEKELLVKAAIYAPCSCNRQSVRLLFIENAHLKKFISKYIPGGTFFFDNASNIILALVDKRDYRFPEGRFTPYQDAAAALQNILLLAETMGLACCWGSITSYGDILDDYEIRKKLNIPDIFLIAGSIAIGKKTKEVFMVPRDNPITKYSINKFD